MKITASQFFDNLNEQEQITVMEAAKIALQDETTLDDMDLATREAFQLVETLDQFLNPELRNA